MRGATGIAPLPGRSATRRLVEAVGGRAAALLANVRREPIFRADRWTVQTAVALPRHLRHRLASHGAVVRDEVVLTVSARGWYPSEVRIDWVDDVTPSIEASRRFDERACMVRPGYAVSRATPGS